MTSISDLLKKYCAVYVDDCNLSDLAVTNPALYFSRMWNYLLPALSLFNIPENMTEFLFGSAEKPNISEPISNFTRYMAVSDTENPFSVPLGTDFCDFDLCSAAIRNTDKDGNIFLMPVSCEYVSETGTVMLSASAENPIAAGTVFEFDFYKDGYFVNTLSPDMMNIIGMCFQVVWQDRFNTDWLSMVSKVEDRSFSEQNRANKMRADTERLEMLMKKLYGEMRRFEQNLYIKKYVPDAKRVKF
ncbi:MAG: hypothetical protein IJ489_08825 [Clostridia bacterium]|nr:hypothetical protein [Clostridia bacterium]